MNNLVVLSALVLLPMIPAYLLFKLLPSRAVVGGPLAGMNVSLGGAFGGYFVVMIFLATQYGSMIFRPTVRVWHVTGRVQLAANDSDHDVHGTVFPPLVAVGVDKSFDILVPVADGQEMPKIALQAKDYELRTVDLSVIDTKYVDKSNNRITLHEPIVMQKKEALAASTVNAQMTGGGS
ncbi:MAG: hypothetical protein JWN02_1788 [Acidobacteria bacterium]|nr:hypothetical protein [Acidobacteriota bacterium]